MNKDSTNLLKKEIEEILDDEMLRMDLANYFMSFPNWNSYNIAECSAVDIQQNVKARVVEKLNTLFSSHQKEVEKEVDKSDLNVAFNAGRMRVWDSYKDWQKDLADVKQDEKIGFEVTDITNLCTRFNSLGKTERTTRDIYPDNLIRDELSKGSGSTNLLKKEFEEKFVYTDNAGQVCLYPNREPELWNWFESHLNGEDILKDFADWWNNQFPKQVPVTYYDVRVYLKSKSGGIK